MANLFKFFIDNEKIDNYQEVYNRVLDIDSSINEMRSDILSFSLGYIDNINRKNNINREQENLTTINLINTVASNDEKVRDLTAQTTLYVMDKCRNIGNEFVKPVSKKSLLDIDDIRYCVSQLTQEKLNDYIQEFFDSIQQRVGELKTKKLDCIANYWQGDNFEAYKKVTLEILDSYLTGCNKFKEQICQNEQENSL